MNLLKLSHIPIKYFSVQLKGSGEITRNFIYFCEISSSHGGEYDVHNHFTRQYIPEDNSEHHLFFFRFLQ
jgi:hypothetical protein